MLFCLGNKFTITGIINLKNIFAINILIISILVLVVGLIGLGGVTGLLMA